MNRSFLSALVLSALAVLASEARAVPDVQQVPDSVPPKWSRSPGTQANSWIITVEENPVGSPQGRRTEFTILRDPLNPTVPVIIEKLTIKRPGFEQSEIEVILGEDVPGSRLTSVQEIVVQEGLTDPPNPVERKGYVNVPSVFLDGSLGIVTGPNLLKVKTETGNVVGPITCFMHSQSDASQGPGFGGFPGEINLESVSGSLVGNVKMVSFVGSTIAPSGVSRGVVGRLDFVEGYVGRASMADPIVPVQILADGLVARIRAREIHGQIMGTNTDPNNPHLDSFMYNIGRIETNRGTVANPASGIFTGEIRAEFLGKDFGEFGQTDNIDVQIVITGDMLGRIWLHRIQSNPDKEIAMAGLTASGASDGPDLFGGIFFSTLCPGRPASEVWGGRVEIGPDFTSGQIVLQGAAAGEGYAHLASALGTGVAGIVPFRTHYADSYPRFPSPSENPSLAPMTAPDFTNPIKIRHYGPVKLPSGGAKAFKIETRSIGGGTWSDISTCFFESLDANPTVVNLRPDRKLPGGFEYQVSQVKNAGVNLLLCDLPSGVNYYQLCDPPVPNPPTSVAVADFTREFRFRVCDSISTGDGESDGVVNFADITSVLTNFGLTDCLRMGDADRDGDRDFADITAVLTNFNATYCATSTQSIVAKGGRPANHMDFEGEMTAASAAMAVGDALAALGYASGAEFSDAIAQMSEEERDAEVRRLGALLEGTP